MSSGRRSGEQHGCPTRKEQWTESIAGLFNKAQGYSVGEQMPLVTVGRWGAWPGRDAVAHGSCSVRPDACQQGSSDHLWWVLSAFLEKQITDGVFLGPTMASGQQLKQM